MYPIILSQNKFAHQDMLKYPYEERGLQFGDGVYEVIRIYNGAYYLLDEHIQRLFRSLKAIKIDIPYTDEELSHLLLDLLKRNSMTSNGIAYLQVTRGSAPRNHVFPENTIPNIHAYVNDVPRKLQDMENGVCTITSRDTRWENCYIKSLNLLPNILAKQEANEKNCYEAILHKNGLVTECSAANVYMVKDGNIFTHPATKSILHGCVRMRVEKFATDLNIPFIEKGFNVNEISSADELFLSSSTSEVMPIINVDGNLVNKGKPGPITRKLQSAYVKDASEISNLDKHSS